MDMDTIVNIFEWVGYVFATIGAGVTIYKAVQVSINYQRFSWAEVDKYTKLLISKIIKDRFTPDLIVTIGRGGAIIGSLLSGNLPKVNSLTYNIPILGTDRMYVWDKGQRIEMENEMIEFAPLRNKSILLVAGDVMTGGTMEYYISKFNAIPVQQIKSACLVKNVSAAYNPNFVGKEIAAKFKMPWMYRGYDYIRDSRHPCNSSTN